MGQSAQQWDLFGFDVRLLGKYWRSAWREFLWGASSPVKSRLDEVVKLCSESTVTYYHAGRVVDQAVTECEAILLPETLVLARSIEMPLAVENDLDAAMAMEVLANSPFPESDTGYGWVISGRNDANFQIQLAIVSLSSTMSYLGRTCDSHQADAQEVWALIDGSPVVLTGFGENRRLRRYNKRLLRVAGMLACSLVLLTLIFGVATGVKNLELKRYQSLSDEVASQARNASDMRSALVAANETISVVNDLVTDRPNPRYVLAKLTHLLQDDASLVNFSLKGRQLKFLGRASNAAEVIQTLTKEPTFAKVESRSAITKIGALEQFTLEIELKSENRQ
ncbi:MAG: PilN domain-containing protein [Halioglobus sp.]